jgi:hypothetical protein
MTPLQRLWQQGLSLRPPPDLRKRLYRRRSDACSNHVRADALRRRMRDERAQSSDVGNLGAE